MTAAMAAVCLLFLSSAFSWGSTLGAEEDVPTSLSTCDNVAMLQTQLTKTDRSSPVQERQEVKRVFVSDALKLLMASGAPRYFFAVTTGHSGTTSLSHGEAFAGANMSRILFQFETIGPEEHDAKAREWQEWWAGSPDDEAQLVKVRDEFKVQVDEKIAGGGLETYVDLGHHTVDGIFRHIPAVFGPRAALLRLRRGRMSTLFSWEKCRNDPSGLTWHILGSESKTAILQPSHGPWTLSSWQKLGGKAQFLWMIDEIEAEWQTLLRGHPNLPYLECDWDSTMDHCFQAVASTLGVTPVNAGHGIQMQDHTHGAELLSNREAMFLASDRAYKEMMGYTDEQLQLISKVQF